MPILLDAFGSNGPEFMWRPRKEWHLGWLPSEIDALDRGVPYPAYWGPSYRQWTEWAELDYFQVRQCWATGHEQVQPLRWKTGGAGHVAVFMTCTWCGERVGSALGKIRLAELGVADTEVLPLANPRRPNTVECERCGSEDHVERHHWAPRHLFDDADSWPIGNLCRTCHVQWHRVVTPNMGRRQAS